jgi:serine/threonine-protein kinase
MSSSLVTIPEKFGRYEVQGLMGEGSMGRVYRAFDPRAQRVVAIKTLKAEYRASDTGDEYLKRFHREAQAAGALSHPHIVTVFDVGDDFFVMELLEGRTLQEILWERGRLELADVLRIVGPMAEAVDYAHSRGTIHRDIKPGNIMILPDGRPKIMDFGVAHLTSTTMTASGQFLGSPSYMAPEQIMRSEASAQTDLFSLAIVIYEMLTGRKPFDGESITTIIYKVVNEEPSPPRYWNTELPHCFDEIFARAFDKEPSRRYKNAGQLVAALELKEVDSAQPLASLLPASSGDASLPPSGEAVETFDFKAEDAARTVMAEPGSLAPPRPPSRTRRGGSLLTLGAAGLVLLFAVLLVRGVWQRRAPALPPAHPLPALQIETEPAGAAVEVDGKPAGRSPLSLATLPTGSHSVRVAHDGFAPAQLSFELVPGVTMAPLRFVLQPMGAALSVRSEPANAVVFVDGKEVGTTPLEGAVLEPGPHDLRVEHKGFRPWTRRLEARVGEALDFPVRLEAGKGRAGAAASKSASWVREGDLVDLTPDVTPPRRVSGHLAPYPDAARRLRLEGAVTIDMIVLETGELSKIHVVESAGEILDQAVLQAVHSWRFEPARKQGVKVRVHWPYRQRFKMGD